jgi:hypothetical protein
MPSPDPAPTVRVVGAIPSRATAVVKARAVATFVNAAPVAPAVAKKWDRLPVAVVIAAPMAR